MKHLLTSKRSKHHRPQWLQLSLLVGATLLVGTINSSQVEASSNLNNPIKATSSLKKNEVKLKELDLIFKTQKDKIIEREKIVANIKKTVESVEQTKNKTALEVATLKQQLAELDDMFVKINRYASDAAGNSYDLGNCTWYVKSRRPDIGNFWGDANNWFTSAQSQGWSVGTKAKVGAIATTTEGWAGHVAYVEKVSRDGQRVTISEMNYSGLYSMNTRTVNFSEFLYIYQLD